MSKIGLIISREYVTRVRKRSFIVLTILTPLLFAGMITAVIYFATSGAETRTIQVVDETSWFKGRLESSRTIAFVFSGESVDSLQARMRQDEVFGVLYIPGNALETSDSIRLFTNGNPGLPLEVSIEEKLEKAVEAYRLRQAGIRQATLDSLQTDIKLKTFNLAAGTGQESNSKAASVVGYAGGFLIYLFIFIYGAQVMRGVIEEKNNRIIEVIVSSVKPFQLMMGKILGISLVGLTQFLIWVLLTLVVSVVGIQFIDAGAPPEVMAGSEVATETAALQQGGILKSLSALPVFQILFSFLFYYLGGYLMYGALFAAIGSAVDSDTDSQQFMLPITIPLIMSIVALAFVLENPDDSLAFWLSIIPLTSPVIMMARIPFVVPWWELALSMILLIGGFVLTTWLAGRIYRVGILIHGSKVSYKVLARWFLMKN